MLSFMYYVIWCYCSDLVSHLFYSREKIRPEKELERAERQILQCKLGIREAVHQLDLLSSEGSIADAVMDPEGRVFHEHVHWGLISFSVLQDIKF